MHTQGEHCVTMKAFNHSAVAWAKECQRLPANLQKVQERHGTDSPHIPQEAPTLLIPLAQASSSENWEANLLWATSFVGPCCGSSSKLISTNPCKTTKGQLYKLQAKRYSTTESECAYPPRVIRKASSQSLTEFIYDNKPIGVMNVHFHKSDLRDWECSNCN